MSCHFIASQSKMLHGLKRICIKEDLRHKASPRGRGTAERACERAVVGVPIRTLLHQEQNAKCEVHVSHTVDKFFSMMYN